MNERFHRRNVPVARDLRVRETSAESLLWQALRDRRLNGYKFRRQHPVGPFVVDFCCLERGLAIELDGAIHDRQQERDVERDAFLAAHGFQILRIPNAEVQQDFRTCWPRSVLHSGECRLHIPGGHNAYRDDENVA